MGFLVIDLTHRAEFARLLCIEWRSEHFWSCWERIWMVM